MFRLEQASRVPRLPVGVVIALVASALFLVGYEVMQGMLPPPATGEVRTACMLRRTTGVPCPACGGTRAVKSAAQFDIAGAFSQNPLIASVGVFVVVGVLVRLLTAQTIRLDCTARGWTILAVVAVLLIAANWVWVLRQHGVFFGTE